MERRIVTDRIIVENKHYKQIEITKTRFICKICSNKRFNRIEHMGQHLKVSHNIEI